MRLFFGIALSQDARRAAAQYARAARQFWPGRYVEADNLHMTLCYVGEVDAQGLSQVRRIGALAAQALPAAPLALGGPGHFGREDKAILYLNALGGRAYAPAAQALRQLLQAAGLPFDPKPFAPHITLARNAALTEQVPPPPQARPWMPEGLTLYHSHRMEGVLVYTALDKWPVPAPSRRGG